MDFNELAEIVGGILALIIAVIIVIIFIIVIYGLVGVCVAFLWNFIMPYAFGLPAINWLHGTALVVLASILFGSRTK